MSNTIADFMFESGSFAEYIKVENDSSDTRHKVKVLHRQAETYDTWYVVTAPNHILKRAELEIYHDVDGIYRIPNNWSLSIVDADELELAEIQSFIKVIEGEK